MWDKRDLKEKLKYLNELSKNTTDKKIRYEIFCNKNLIIEMLELLEGKKLTINRTLSALTRKLSLIKEERKYSNYEFLSFDTLADDLNFSFELCKNIALSTPFDKTEIDNVLSQEECINEVINFAIALPDKELRDDIISTVKDDHHIYFFNNPRDSFHLADNYGLSLFKESYIASPLMPDILLHECIHTIDKKRNRYFIENYPYSYEVPSYTLQLYKNLKEGNLNFLNELITISKTTLLLACKGNGMPYSNTMIENLNSSDIINKTANIIERLLTIKSILVATIFTKKILDNEEEGLKEYKEMLNTSFSKDEIPDYSRWGITNEVIIDYSKNLDKYFNIYQKERGGKSI